MRGASLVRANALALPFADASVDLVCTSPPYFGLRSYTDSGVHYAGQLGSEPTPLDFVDALIAATREMVRVLKPSGSIWVNLGDKYAGGRMDGSSDWSTATLDHDPGKVQLAKLAASQGVLATNSAGIRTKSLMGIPWRYAIRCIDELGLILRAEVIWSKPNGLPGSVTDRVRRSHEQWFHFTKSPRYYAAVDEIREAGPTSRAKSSAGVVSQDSNAGLSHRTLRRDPELFNPLGKLPGSVWSVPTQPLTVPESLGVDHFAAFPMEWPRRIIRGWSPSGICTGCGEGRRPVTRNDYAPSNGSSGFAKDLNEPLGRQNGTGMAGKPALRSQVTITGETCACYPLVQNRNGLATPIPPTRPAVVLDPFGGTGTTALVADANGRLGVSVDMSADYLRIARWRTTDPGQRAAALAAALQVEKPAAVSQDEALFGLDWGDS
jgi:DNA modification methylase